MLRKIKQKIIGIPLFEWIAKQVELRKWKKNGCPSPTPHIYKEKTIQEYANKHNMRYFIETGTYLGDMVKAQANLFSVLSSVELSEELYDRARDRFKAYNNVRLYQGESEKMLPQMIADLPQSENILFWLDGHFSGGITARGDKETPIMEEVDYILDNTDKCVILIDDARLFVGENDYPTLDSLRKFAESKRSLEWNVENDIIRIII